MNDELTVRFTEGGGGCLSEVTIIGDPWVDDTPALELTDMFTHPKLRRKGYARKVLNRAVKWADQRGYDLWLRVAPFGRGGAGKPQLQALYESVGFKHVEEWQWYRRCSKSK